MATKADRGTKRTCQDESCGSRFYDLARDPITCPICGAAYKIIVEPPSAIRRQNRKFEHVQKAPPPIEAVKEADEEIATVEVEGEVDDTIILDDEEDGDVSGIVDGPAKEET
jgi:uncharacterized protein (TIGR02300 family)